MNDRLALEANAGASAAAASGRTGGGGTSVAHRYLRRLERHGVQYLFGNAGTDFAPLIEALSQGDMAIRPVLVPHENVAVAMAYGYTLATGRPQVVMVHVGIGTANALCGLFNASRQQVPMILAAGRTPVLEHGRLGARNNYINWAQEMFDQAGMLRELVKWDYELRDPAQVEEVVDRAFAAAQSSPAGPAYVVLPREVLAAEAPPVEEGGCGVQDPTGPGLPLPDRLARGAELLLGARRPLLITADAGRSPEGFDALTRFAQALDIPVVQYRPRFLSLPCSASTHAGYDPHRWLPQADLVVVVDADVPWLPGPQGPAPGVPVVQIGPDPLWLDYPMRSFRSELTLQGHSPSILAALLGRVDAAGRKAPDAQIRADRRQWLTDVAEHSRAPAAAGSQLLTHRHVSQCIAAAMDDDCILFNEYPFTLEDLRIDDHGRYYSHSPAGGLGWAVGAAMGMRLARPDKTVIAAVGDGCYMFSNPTPAHFVSRAQGLPFITVIYNNRRWAAVQRATLSVYPDGQAARSPEPVFATLEPAPDYEQIVQACGGLGIRVAEPAELPAALERAKHTVRTEQRQVVINVLTHIDYARSS